MPYVLLFVVLWICQVGAVTVIAKADWLRAQLDHERLVVEAYLGPDTAQQLVVQTGKIFELVFVRTDLIETVRDALVPQGHRYLHGMEHLAPWIFRRVDDSLNALWTLSYQAIYRVLLIWEWAPYLGATVVAAVVDGLVSRRIRKANYGYANPVRHRAGLRVLVVLIFVPLIYLTLPMDVTPLVIPVWLLALAATLMLVTANEQDRI